MFGLSANMAAIVLGPYALYWLWRFSYYQSVVANTATAKVHMTSSTLVRGMSYLGLYVTTLITPLFLLLSIPRGRSEGRPQIAGGLFLRSAPWPSAFPRTAWW